MNAKDFADKVKAKAEAAEAAIDFSAMTETEAHQLKMKIAGKAKSDVHQEEKDAALKMLLELAKEVAGDDESVKNAIDLLTKKTRAPGSGVARAPSAPRVSRFTLLEVEFPEVGATVHEDDLYKKYKQGRKEIYWIIADAIKSAKAENVDKRKWISFDPDSGIYTYVAQGELPPDGWKGYVPQNLKDAPAAE